MRPLIERSEWLFSIVKGVTLLVAWAVMAYYAHHNRQFVRKACLCGSFMYIAIWVVWFLKGS